MRYVVIKEDDNYLRQFWCYYVSCDTCRDRFGCFTEAAVIVDDCFNLKEGDVIKRLKSKGIIVDRLAEF